MGPSMFNFVVEIQASGYGIRKRHGTDQICNQTESKVEFKGDRYKVGIQRSL